MSDTYFLIVGIILIACGALAILAIIHNKLSCTERVNATICKVNKTKSFWKGKNFVSYQPVFAYSYAGKAYKTTAAFSTSNKEKYPYHGKIDILINPKNPSSIYVKKRIGLLVNALIDIALGAILIAVYFL